MIISFIKYLSLRYALSKFGVLLCPLSSSREFSYGPSVDSIFCTGFMSSSAELSDPYPPMFTKGPRE